MANDKGSGGQEQLNAAIAAADVKTILTLLDDPSLDLNARDLGHDLQTPLMRMCHMPVETDALCAILDKLENCAWNPNVQDATGRALLIHGCIADKIDVVDMCLANGCDVSLVDRDGNSAIIYAIRSGNENMLRLILEQEECFPLLTQTNNLGYTPIEVANQEGHVAMANRLSALLTSHISKVKRRSKGKGETPRNGKTLNRKDSLSHHILETNGMPNSHRHETENGHSTYRPPNSTRQPKISEHVIQKLQLSQPDKSASNGDDDNMTQRGMTSESSRTGDDRSSFTSEKRHKNSLEGGKSRSKKSQRLLRRESEEQASENDKLDTHRGKPVSKQLLFCRKDSASLPDLRDFKGKLVTSGDVTPADALDSPFDSSELRSNDLNEEEEDVFNGTVEVYKKSSSSCSLPPLLSNSADSDRRRDRKTHTHRSKPPKKTNSHEEVMLRSLIV